MRRISLCKYLVSLTPSFREKDHQKYKMYYSTVHGRLQPCLYRSSWYKTKLTVMITTHENLYPNFSQFLEIVPCQPFADSVATGLIYAVKGQTLS